MNFKDKSKGILCLVRHGQTAWNLEGRMQGREEVPLNDNGINQAKDAALGIKKATESGVLKFNKVISSPLERAYDTAKIISEQINIDSVSKDDRLLERDFGILSGYTYENYARAIHANAKGVEDIESIDAMLERIRSYIADEVKPGNVVLSVTHGAMASTLAKYSEKNPSIPEESIGGVGNCHVSFYTYDGERIVLDGFNINPKDVAEFVAKNTEE